MTGFVSGCQDNAVDEPKGRFADGSKHTGAMVLALSWQPAFCETRPRLPECKSQDPNRYDAYKFSLHGLWPQPGNNIYCDVNEEIIERDKRRKWKELGKLNLSGALTKDLQRVMPGVRSYLHRHEWVKHGTCYSAKPETYYRDSLRLMNVINASAVQNLFSVNAGKEVSGDLIRRAFDEAFGVGAGERVRVSCKQDDDRTLITEITLGLAGEVSENQSLAELILNAPATRPGCPRGIVDYAGFQ